MSPQKDFWLYLSVRPTCVPIIMHGLPACFITKSEKIKLVNSLDVILAKVIGTFNKNILRHCLYYCDIQSLSRQLDLLKMKFLNGLDQLYSINTDYYFFNEGRLHTRIS